VSADQFGAAAGSQGMSGQCCAWHIGDLSCDVDGMVCCAHCPSPDGDAYRNRGVKA
jgi:hypothetical protein